MISKMTSEYVISKMSFLSRIRVNVDDEVPLKTSSSGGYSPEGVKVKLI